MERVITLTFGDTAENHRGMEQIGSIVKKGDGFNINDLENIKQKSEEMGALCDLYELGGGENNLPEAFFLVIKDGINILAGDCNYKNKLFEEQLKLQYDTKAFMYGRVVNKNARWNLCYAKEGRNPEYSSGKGTIVSYDDVPLLKKIISKMEDVVGEKGLNLNGESNYYYDINKCGIGFHGDAERRKVIGLKLGDVGTPIYFQWFQNSKPVGKKFKVELNIGDIYLMCEKAVGTDWRSKKVFTLRHAVGCKTFTTVK